MDAIFPIRDPVLIFAVVAGLILLSPILLGRYRLPGMIGLLLAGALLGPNALGVLARDQSFVLLGTVGLLYIMFIAALEIDLAIFKRYRVHSVVFGLLTFALPQGLGMVVGYYLLGFDVLGTVLLASLFASHTLLAYPIASRLGLAKSQAVATAVGGTILTDTLALLVLAVVASLKRGEMDETFWLRLGASITVYVAAILFGLPALARWFFRRIAQDGVSEFAFVLAVLFGCASLSHAAGVEPIVGAFLAGLALNRLIPHSSTLMSRIQFIGEAVFVPFFLLSVGMLLDVRIFAGGLRSWAIAFGMLATVTVTKWLAAEATRLLLGYSRDQARMIFGLTVAQAAATLAATMVGYDLGLFDDAVVNGAILMILGTCALAPIVTDRHGRPLSELAEAEASEEASGPPQRVVVALANPASAPPLLELAQLVRDPGQAQPIYPLAVVEEGEPANAHVVRAEKMLSKAVLQLSAADVPSSPVTRIDLNVPAGILRARRELRGTDVIVGWGGRASRTEFLFGSMIDNLLADPHYTLIVSRLVDPLNTCQRVLFAVPPNAEQELSFLVAARMVKRLSLELGAKLIVLCPRAHEDRVKKRMQLARPGAELSFRPLETWPALTQSLADTLSDSDLIALCGTRTSSVALRATARELPSRLAQRFAENNLLVIYPAEPEEDPAHVTASVELALSIDRVVLDLDVTSLRAAIDALVAQVPTLTRGADWGPLAQRLHDSAEELSPGLVLIHAESELARAPAAVFGVSKQGLARRDGSGRSHLFVLLLDPPGRDATRHLHNLAAVARMFQAPEVIERVRAAADADELRALLSDRARPAPRDSSRPPAPAEPGEAQ